jgi:excisionase family DNA binding protein
MPDESVKPRYLTPKQAAQYLGLSVFSVYRLVNRRVLPFIPVRPTAEGTSSKRRALLRFDIQALDAWMKKQAVRPIVEAIDDRGAQ